ncbi:hypothetical protein [Zoogloea dura]|uniref:Tyr recombinase domain-containing protein n=1 Tax=Zoogloea dura TaxID=2728840 RepID=A0A848GA73_9RHOO|nr:hypothetical protein [Zoogloea dura]NML28250.1 hypothetical protein [Zoogloea dura]
MTATADNPTMPILSSLRRSLELDITPDQDGVSQARRINQRRIRVFATVFLLVLLPGLLWNFLRPAEYRATTRVQISPGSTELRPATPAVQVQAERPRTASELLTQVQVLTSRPLLEKVAAALGTAGMPLPGADAAARLREMISAEAVEGTEVVELQATGTQPEQLAAALNKLVDIYREDMKASYGAVAGESLAQARQEAERLAATVQARRQRVEAFRNASGGLSPERDENEAVARVKGLTASLNAATEKAAVAEARLKALKAGGKGATGAEDPTLANMEARASQLAEEIRQMERTYTPEFMRMDPRAKQLQTRFAEMERQIEAQRVTSRENTLQAAQDDYAGARATVDRLQAEIRSQRGAVQDFSQRFTQAKTLEDDLAQIERASREAQERLARLEASEKSRLPALSLVEAAGVPLKPFRPDYMLDGLIVLGVAFSLGLLAIWFVELFNRPPQAAAQASTTVIMPQPWGGPAAAPGMAGLAAPGQDAPVLAGAAPGLLAAHARPPRELSQEEVVDLLAASSGEGRFVLGLLLMGLTAEEAVALSQGDFSGADGWLRVGGAAQRRLETPAWMAGCRPSAIGGSDAPLLQDAAGARLQPADIQSMLACAAFDAGLSSAGSIDAEVLRHTCIAWLVRQGLRFAELGGLVGRPSPEALAIYASLAPEGAKLPATEIDPLMPALRAMGA